MKSAFKTAIPAAALAIFAGACTHHTIETSSEVKPIHIVIDVNVKVDKDLDKFFGEAEKTALQQQVKQAATEATQNAVQQAQAKPQAAAVSLDEALKPAPADNAPEREVMMGRFAARMPAIKELKAKGIVGEDAKGLLQFVTEKKESEELIAVENSDRAVIYSRIAKKQGSTPNKVASLKAAKNALKAAAGEYIQDASGNWAKKQ